MPKKEEASSRGSTAQPKVVRVLVDMKAPSDRDETFAMETASAIDLAGFNVDSTYEPVPSGPIAVSEMAAELEHGGNRVITVRGQLPDDKIEDLKAQDNVNDVWLDTRVAPLPDLAESEDQEFFLEALAPGNCPIPPCDCDHGTAACSKGSLNDVRTYLGVDQIWNAGHRGNGIVIGIVDGGITAAGRVSGGTIPRVIGGWPTANWGKIAAWGRHGNMTATDAMGMANQAKVYDIRISDGNAISNALAGFQWALTQFRQNGTPQILSNSWGIWQKSWDPGYAIDPNHPFTRKVIEAINEGIIVLFAAGNCGDGCQSSSKCGPDHGPGKSIWGANGHPRVMTVGAANIQGRLVGYSSQGPAALDPHKPDFCGISHFTGYFTCDTGTSAACPVAAGVVALLKECKPTATQDVIKTTLKGTARNIGPPGWDPHSGSGIIDAKKAYDKLCITVTPCNEYRKKALQHRSAYQKTRNRKHLCEYYRYMSMYYKCLHKTTSQRKYLCLYFRFRAAFFRCQYQLTNNRKHLCTYYMNLAKYYYCQYRLTRKRSLLCLYYQTMARYYRCQFQLTQNKKSDCLYHLNTARYWQCRYQVGRQRQHLCSYYLSMSRYYLCLYRLTRDQTYLARYRRFLDAYRKCRGSV